MILSALSLLLAGASLASAAGFSLRQDDSTSTDLPTISLGYSTVQAASYNYTTAGKYYVFQNIRYAAPPTGELRWAAPQDPYQEDGVNNGTSTTTGTQGCKVAEDCLFLDVYVPADALEQNKSLPVLFWNYGGGWVGGSKNENDPAGLLQVAQNGFIHVSYNYRLGIFGVGNGPTLQRAGGISNVAIYDAHKALDWVNLYISQFGGDPNTVTNWGFSAGGSQVLASLAAFGGRDFTPKFQRAVINSPGWVPGAGHAQADRYMQNVSQAVGCSFGLQADTVACLRGIDFDTLRSASENITSEFNYQMQPRADGVVLPDTAEYLLTIGQFHKGIQVMVGHSELETNQKMEFADNQAFRDQFKIVFPSMNDWAIDMLEEVYPLDAYNNSNSDRFARCSRDYDLVAKTLPVTNAYDNATYNYLNLLSGATHGSDQAYWWYNPNVTSPRDALNSTEIDIALRMQAYLASFVITGDPNAMFSNATTYWPQYGSNDTVLQLSEDGTEVIGDELDASSIVFWNHAYWY
ncbi:alpha/beta-hydrolase [Cylindrobasidium torrendii FP15055 ss-10]|uniref:Alpha/beta-hydrolase n=1 Tax=Cylindrobasidium torrendii FP15055 ss-10 TaxID=1314674 RepID=A0A0D7BIW2_9AGAR|nr:alpha/beta-hydrolase [Cylindrobasidium torrendii FP15055 ss-10]